MNKPRFYFSDYNEEGCYTLKSMYELMGDEEMEELVIYPAVMVVGMGFYYCSELGEVGEVGEGCGKECKHYQPRNGKNGRCRFSNNCYEPDYKNPITIKHKK